jgi:predicted secreted protein
MKKTLSILALYLAFLEAKVVQLDLIQNGGIQDTILLTVGDNLVVTLSETASSGYIWSPNTEAA